MSGRLSYVWRAVCIKNDIDVSLNKNSFWLRGRGPGPVSGLVGVVNCACVHVELSGRSKDG